MFPAALVVFRESLEAALFIGIVAAAARGLAGRQRWLGAGVGVGALGAVALALIAEQASAGFDGLGQDIVNIGALSLALAMLLWHSIWAGPHARQTALEARRLGQSVRGSDCTPWALLAAVALAVLREGAETVLFVGGVVAASGATLGAVLLSCAAGLALGATAGWLVYAGLARIPPRHVFATTDVLMALLAGSIASQLARTLAQAGLVDRWSSPLWDSSSWLAVDSPLGTLLHALVGYDARPSGLQLAAYLAVVLLILGGSRALKSRTAASP